MVIKEIKGDIITLLQAGVVDVIAHGCNCEGMMGAGLARTIAHHYPEAASQSYLYCKHIGIDALGTAQCISTKDGFIFNLYTQTRPGPHANLTALDMAVGSMLDQISQIWDHVPTLALPHIGSGIGGLKWSDVKYSIEQSFKLSLGGTLFLVEYDKQPELF